MTLLLIIPAWLLLMSLVAGLCMAARAGDVELRREQALSEQSRWEPEISVMAGPRARSTSSREKERSGVGVAA